MKSNVTPKTYTLNSLQCLYDRSSKAHFILFFTHIIYHSNYHCKHTPKDKLSFEFFVPNTHLVDTTLSDLSNELSEPVIEIKGYMKPH